MKKRIFDQKAITLISLVVTIVIIVILAAVAINVAIGNNGLFSKAKYAVSETKKAEATEQMQMVIIEKQGELAAENKEVNLQNIADKFTGDELERFEYVLTATKVASKLEKVDVTNKDRIFVKLNKYDFEFEINNEIQIVDIKVIGKVDDKNSEDNLPENGVGIAAGTPVKIPEGWYTEVEGYVNENGSEVKVASLKTLTVAAVSDGEGNTIPIPKNFYYVGGNISSGIVISDNPNDQNKYATSSNGDVGVDLQGNQFVWIPCSINDYKKTDFGSSYANAGWDNQTSSSEKAQINKYGGFYIGRYEAGLGDSGVTNKMQAVTASTNSTYSWTWQSNVYSKETLSTSAKPTSKANEIPWFHANYFTAVEMSERMYNTNSSVSSGLVTGTMWDVMVKYIATENEYTSSGTWGNYNDSSITINRGYYTNVNSSGTTDGFKAVTSGQVSGTRATNYNYVLLSTGASDSVKKKNIFDVAGNLWEWTDEAAYVASYSNYSKTNFDVNTYMLRGGSFDNAYGSYPACFRSRSYAASTYTNRGFRVALYVK